MAKFKIGDIVTVDSWDIKDSRNRVITNFKIDKYGILWIRAIRPHLKYPHKEWSFFREENLKLNLLETLKQQKRKRVK